MSQAAAHEAMLVRVADPDDSEGRRERLAMVGLVAAGIGHDLRNPLAVIESSAFILRGLVGDDRARRHVETISNAVQSCTRIVSSLLALARGGMVERREVRPAEVFAAALAQIGMPDDTAIEVVVDDGLVLYADAGLLEQVIANLLTNALHSLDRRAGAITLAARRHDAGVEIVVADDGPGFDPAILPHAFEALVTGTHDGVGLGLALVRCIVERHGGRVTAENPPGGGALVRLVLPTSASGGSST